MFSPRCSISCIFNDASVMREWEKISLGKDWQLLFSRMHGKAYKCVAARTIVGNILRKSGLKINLYAGGG